MSVGCRNRLGSKTTRFFFAGTMEDVFESSVVFSIELKEAHEYRVSLNGSRLIMETTPESVNKNGIDRMSHCRIDGSFKFQLMDE